MVASSTPSPHAVSRESKSYDVQALKLAVTPTLYANNAFRIIGIHIDATARDIAKQMAQRKLRAELGDTSTGTNPLFGDDAPSIDRQRNAELQLRDPAARLVHELFWFWPMDARGCASDPALHALAAGNTATAEKLWRAMESNPQSGGIASHNIAIRWHIAALQLESKLTDKPGDEKSRETLAQCWNSSLKRWNRLRSDDAFWHFIAARVVALNDPRLSLGHVDGLRRHFAAALGGINVELVIKHTESGAFDLVTMHIRLIRDSSRLFDNEDTFALLVLARAKDLIRRRVEAVKKLLEDSPATAIDASRDLANALKRHFRLFGLLDLLDNQNARDVIDEGVTAALNCAIQSNKHTDDDAAFVDVVGDLSTLACGATVKARADKNLELGKNALLTKQLTPVFDALTAVRDSTASQDARLQAFERDVSPRLTQALTVLPASEPVRADLVDAAAILLREISVDAWNKGKDGKTALAALNRATVLGGSDATKKALYEDLHTLQKLLMERAAAQREKRLKFTVVAVALVAILMWASGVFDGPQTPSNRASSPASGQTGQPAVNAAGTPSHGASLVDESQQTYRVPASAVAQLELESGNIDAQKAIQKQLQDRLDLSESALNAEHERADSIDAQVDALKNQLDRARAMVDDTNSASIASFNARVDQYNRLVQQSRAQRRKANALVGPHNDLVAKVNAQQRVVNQMIDAYNSHLQNVGH